MTMGSEPFFLLTIVPGWRAVMFNIPWISKNCADESSAVLGGCFASGEVG